MIQFDEYALGKKNPQSKVVCKQFLPIVNTPEV